MPLLALLLAAATQSPSASDASALSEWQLITDPRIWGADGQDLFTSEPQQVPPLEVNDWLYVPHRAAISTADVLARWILQPKSSPPKEPTDDEKEATVDWHKVQPGDLPLASAAFAAVTSPADEVRLARAPGAKWFVWNGELFVGDPQSRGFGGVPVRVRRGLNTCFLALDGAQPRCSLEVPVSEAWIEVFDVRWPASPSFGDGIEYPIFNATERTIEPTARHGYATHWSADCLPVVSEVGGSGRIAPLSLHLCEHAFSSWSKSCEVNYGAGNIWMPVAASGGTRPDRRMLRRGPSSVGADRNNVLNVPRESRSVARGLPVCLPARSTHLYAIGASENESLALARFVQQLTWYRLGDVSVLASASDYLSDERRGGALSLHSWSSPIVLYGNADSNPAWQRFVPSSVQCDVRNGRALVRGIKYDGDDLAGWFNISKAERSRDFRSQDGAWRLVTTPKDEHDVCVFFDTGERGARLAALLAVSWDGPQTPTAVFRVDLGSPRGWNRVDVAEER